MHNKKYSRPIAIWLFICCFMVFLMVVVGGVTRLTESGLSIVEWQPVSGIFPPIHEEEWQEVFTKYRQSPEYKKINHGMSLHEFKEIFWLEFIHRLLGRLTGLIFFVPFIYFMYKKRLGRNFSIKLLGIFALGGLQGLMGWYMVKSGLIDDPKVSPYRLTAHLALAFVIFGLLFLSALRLWFAGENGVKTTSGAGRLSKFVTGIIFLQVLAGGFVAGNDAGLTYNTFPLMDGKLVPDGLFIKSPWFLNFFENVTMVQFMHRVIAAFLVLFILYFWRVSASFRLNERVKFAINLLLLIMALQFSLGIATLLHHVPIILASLHQAVALGLFAVSLFINQQLCASLRPFHR